MSDIHAALRRAEQARFVNHPRAAFRAMRRLADDVEVLAKVIAERDAELFKCKEFLRATAATLVQERRALGIEVKELRDE